VSVQLSSLASVPNVSSILPLSTAAAPDEDQTISLLY
jgi:hypothetical protein